MSATIPDELHALRGTRPTRAGAAQPSKFAAGKPKMPSYLGEAQKEKWREMIRLLASRGTLTRADGPALEIFVETWSRWRACLKEVEEHGVMVTIDYAGADGASCSKRIINPASKLANQLEVSMRLQLQQFSATPASREKSKPAAPDPDKKPKIKPGEDSDPIIL